MLFLFFSLLSSSAFCWDLPASIGPQLQDSLLLRYTEQAEPKPNGDSSHIPAGIESHNFSFSVPVAKNQKDNWSLLGRAAWLDIHSAAMLPSGANIPNTLMDTRIGFAFTHQLGGERSWGLTSSFGSASDKPFSSGQVDTINANGTYAFSESERSRWMLFLNYSNNRGFLNNIPLPGFAYIYTPSKAFTGVFGVPFAMLNWRIDNSDWSLNAMLFFPRFGKLEAVYSKWRPLSLFAALEATEQSFLRLNRTYVDNRLVYLESRSLIGARSPLSKTLLAELSGGYAFARSFYEADKFSDRNSNSVSIASGAIYMATISARF